MVANSHHAQHVRHYDIHWPREVPAERDIDGQLANVEERRRKRRREETQLVLRAMWKIYICLQFTSGLQPSEASGSVSPTSTRQEAHA